MHPQLKPPTQPLVRHTAPTLLPFAAVLCRTLYIPPDDRSGWEQLQAQVLYLLAQILAARPKGPHNVQVGCAVWQYSCAIVQSWQQQWQERQ
jgi:hypothetical protein